MINEVYFKRNLCNKNYHSVCTHPFSSVIEQIAGQEYVCFNCIHNKKSFFYYFIAWEAFHTVDISENFIKRQHEMWQSLPPHNKIDFRHHKFHVQKINLEQNLLTSITSTFEMNVRILFV